MRLLDHIESFLGPTEGGWKDPAGEVWPFQVVQFSGRPVPKTMTFCTLGLSEYPLKRVGDHAIIRLELMLVVHDVHGPMSIPALLHDLGVQAMSQEHAFFRGQVIGPRGPLFPGSELEALYVTAPMHLPDEFNDIETEDGDLGFIAWLLPIASSEADFIHSNGWDEFENLLVERQRDVFDVFRKPIVR
jgi:hypothetical protein